MRYSDRKIRNSWQYKFKMWFFHLTCQDIGKAAQKIFYEIEEFLVLILIFLFIFVIPHFFH